MTTTEQKRAYLESLPQRREAVFSGDNPLVSLPAPFVPDVSADEETIRAREAVIATGYFPAADEIIRSGGLDHSHCLQTALEVQRGLPVPLERLALVPHAPRALVRENHLVPKRSNPFMRWWSRVQRQMMHFKMRHERALHRVACLEAENELLRENNKRLTNDNLKYQQGTWSWGVEVAVVSGPKGDPYHVRHGNYVPHECANCGAGLGHHPSNWIGAIKCHTCNATNSRHTPDYGSPIRARIVAEETHYNALAKGIRN